MVPLNNNNVNPPQELGLRFHPHHLKLSPMEEQDEWLPRRRSATTSARRVPRRLPPVDILRVIFAFILERGTINALSLVVRPDVRDKITCSSSEFSEFRHMAFLFCFFGDGCFLMMRFDSLCLAFYRGLSPSPCFVLPSFGTRSSLTDV